MSYEEFVKLVSDTKTKEPRWRQGQTLFNVLWRIRPDLSEQIRTTELDPFHQDKRIDACLAWIQKNW